MVICRNCNTPISAKAKICPACGAKNTKPFYKKASETETPPDNSSELVDGMRPEFKEAMDSYEEFMDSYCEFMVEYSENPGVLGLLVDYAEFMADYAEFSESFEKWDDEDMNAAETAYYIEVQTRVNQSLLEVAS